MKIKIGLLALVSQGAGGVFQYTQSLIDALQSDSRHEFVVFCNVGDESFDCHDLEVRKILIAPRAAFRTLSKLIQLIFLIRSATFFTSSEQEAFADIDFFISPVALPYPHYFLNKPFIFTLHDLQEKYYPSFFSISDRLFRFLVSRALSRYARAILCESNFVKRDILKFVCNDSDRIFVIPSPPPSSLLSFTLDHDHTLFVKQKYHLPDVYIFYPAQCLQHKNHSRLIRAFKNLPPCFAHVHLVLTGPRTNSYMRVMALITTLGLSSRVRHLGFVEQEEIPYLYLLSTFLVMPTLFESISMPVFEAFALGVPVCASRVVGLPEQIGTAGLLFDPLSINDITEMMVRLLSSSDLRSLLVQRGFQRLNSIGHNSYRESLLRLLPNV
jgi:glycosyltransferase involved in cell wall biosynthesis